jgi:hypothetical protein
MMEPFTWKFRDEYREAFMYYKNGDWLKARDSFKNAIGILKRSPLANLDDPLSEIHLEFMRERNFQAPERWCGHKHFDE